MFRLFDVVQTREQLGKQHSLQGWLNQKIEDNLRKDVLLTRKIPVKGILRLGHCNEFAAVLEDNNTLSFFNLSTSQRLWTAPIANLADHCCTDLLASDTGVVLYVTMDAQRANPHEIQIIQNGNKLGSFMMLHYPTLNIINNRIFSRHSPKYGVEITERTLTGEKIHLQTLHSHEPESAASDNFYVVCVVDRTSRSSTFSAFVFDLQKNQHHIFTLFKATEADKEFQIDKISISNHDLVVGFQYSLPGSRLFGAKPPEFMVYNLANGQLLKKYNNLPNFLAAVWTNHLVVNEYYIAFLRRSTHSSKLYSINRKTNVIHALKTPYGTNETMALSLTNHLLIACSTNRNNYEGAARTERYVIDLETGAVKQEIEYLHAPARPAYFSCGLFVYPVNPIHVENFCTLERDDQASRSIRLNAPNIRQP